MQKKQVGATPGGCGGQGARMRRRPAIRRIDCLGRGGLGARSAGRRPHLVPRDRGDSLGLSGGQRAPSARKMPNKCVDEMPRNTPPLFAPRGGRKTGRRAQRPKGGALQADQ